MDTTVTVDETEYYIDQPEQIIGILVSMIQEALKRRTARRTYGTLANFWTIEFSVSRTWK